MEGIQQNITIQGRGGTDFRPVFRYVKEQQEKKEIRSLKALIYFTDGDGIYPGSKPDYETAFVFYIKQKNGACSALGDSACGRAGRSALQNMNIKEAKEEIKHTLLAYNRKDAAGRYTFPKLRQRPILLMGPPGIGKTAIMEQVAEECEVGLVAYTITHHTRQSAVGLPRIVTRCYNGKEVSITEYTLSEIIASVYDCMERTGKKEGILFIDEINCVSETLAPTMLQFLQNKTFGSHSVPEGWLIAAAGNPPEYNKSVREFDIVTLDRVRRMDIEADLEVWMEYAWKRKSTDRSWLISA